jgi:hypothetical protein
MIGDLAHFALFLVVHAMGSVTLLQLLPNVTCGIELQGKCYGPFLPSKCFAGDIIRDLCQARERA